MKNAFVSGPTTIQFSSAPLRAGSDEAMSLPQASGFDSAGAQYVYWKSRSNFKTHHIVLPKVSDSTLASLRAFLGTTTRGSKKTFTWYDEASVMHTVRLVPGSRLDSRQVGPNRHEVSLVLEEAIPAAIMSPAASFDEAKNRQVTHPVWILKISAGGSIYYLSDDAYSLFWNGATVATLPWVSQWGQVAESVSGDLSEIKVSDFSVECISDPDEDENLSYLATAYPLEESPAELYLWFNGLDAAVDPPRMKLRGYITDVTLPDETSVHLTIEDESSRLHEYVGTRVSLEDYPGADPDDVGRVIPIVYGSVSRLPALALEAGVMTSLPAAISESAVTFALSDASAVTNGMVLWVDQEKLLVTAKAGDSVTVTRGYGGTIAVPHDRAATVWEDRDEFVYVAADHPLQSIPKVWGRVGEGVLDITSICTRYPAGNHPGYPGKAVVTIPGYVTAEQAVQLGTDLSTFNVTLSGATVASIISLIDPGHTHNTGQSNSEATTSQLPSTQSVRADGLYGLGTGPFYVSMAFPSEGARSSVTYTITLTPDQTVNGVAVYAYVNSTRYYTGSYNFVSGSSTTFSFTVAGDIRADNVVIVAMWALFRITGASRTIMLTSLVSSASSAAISKVGVGTATATKGGDIAITGNSVANTLVGDQILVDCVRGISVPGDVFDDFLSRYAADESLQVVGAFPAGYALHGAITEYRRLIDWLDYWAFQLRAYYRKTCGVSWLIVRPDAPASTKTINACALAEDGAKVYSRRKVPLDRVINKLSILYGRDWSKEKTDQPYRAVAKGTNATSISRYGVRERPDLFMFDFVAGSVMANSLRDFYLSVNGERGWLHETRVYLDHSELKFADGVTLGFGGGVVGEVQESKLAPGSAERMDAVDLVVLVS